MIDILSGLPYGELYNVVYSEDAKTIRFHKDDEGYIKLNKETGEQLVAQVEGSCDAADIVHLIQVLRPDLTIDIVQ